MKAIFHRDFYMNPTEAVEIGLIDEVLEHSRWTSKPRHTSSSKQSEEEEDGTTTYH